MKHLEKKESQVNTYDMDYNMDWLDILIDTKEMAIKLDAKLPTPHRGAGAD